MTIPDLSQWFADAVRDMPSRGGVTASLEETCRLAVGVIDGCEGAGVALAARQGRIDTPAATDDVVREIHAMQYELRGGPCLDAIWREHIVQVNDLTRSGSAGLSSFRSIACR